MLSVLAAADPVCDTASQYAKAVVTEWLFKYEFSNQILNATQGEVKSCLSSRGPSNKLFHGRDTENV